MAMAFLDDISRRRPGELLYLIKITGLLLAIRMGLRILPFSVMLRLLSRVARTVPAPPGDAAYEQRTVRAIARVGSRILGTRPCLVQALATHFLLQRRGISSRIHIGVTKDEHNQLQAHAWVERGETILIGGTDAEIARYTPLFSVDGERV